MARTARNSSLESRTARARLQVRRTPYFAKIAKGLRLGYYRGSVSGSWIARYYRGDGVYATEALGLARDAVERYEHRFGARHLLTVAARINLAVILRTLGEKDEARATDEACLGIAAEVVGPDHPYTLCAATGLANDLVLDHDLEQAYRMDLDTLEKSRRSRGADHPYTLSCAINAGLGMQKVGDSAAGRALLQETVERMAQVLGSEHPETLDAGRGKRAECDIEPPPT